MLLTKSTIICHGNQMTIENINIDETLKRVESLIANDQDLSAATRSLLEVLVLIITLLANRLN